MRVPSDDDEDAIRARKKREQEKTREKESLRKEQFNKTIKHQEMLRGQREIPAKNPKQGSLFDLAKTTPKTKQEAAHTSHVKKWVDDDDFDSNLEQISSEEDEENQQVLSDEDTESQVDKNKQMPIQQQKKPLSLKQNEEIKNKEQPPLPLPKKTDAKKEQFVQDLPSNKLDKPAKILKEEKKSEIGEKTPKPQSNQPSKVPPQKEFLWEATEEDYLEQDPFYFEIADTEEESAPISDQAASKKQLPENIQKKPFALDQQLTPKLKPLKKDSFEEKSTTPSENSSKKTVKKEVGNQHPSQSIMQHHAQVTAQKQAGNTEEKTPLQVNAKERTDRSKKQSKSKKSASKTSFTKLSKEDSTVMRKQEKNKKEFEQQAAPQQGVFIPAETQMIEKNEINQPSSNARSNLQELARQIIDRIQVMQQGGDTKTQITLKNPPLLVGSTITLTSSANAQNEYNISFGNLSYEAKTFLDKKLHKDSLTKALQKKGVVVHMVTTTVERENLVVEDEET